MNDVARQCNLSSLLSSLHSRQNNFELLLSSLLETIVCKFDA